jgi:phosphoribosylaminoimidazole-succinocarboxamide synthase
MPLLETNLPDRLYRGKVRDTFDLGDGLLLMVATDRVSAFDVVLPDGISDKGYVLSRLSVFWFDLTKHLIANHMVGMADEPARLGDLASHPKIAGLPAEIARQAMVVKRAERVDVECVVRGYITGSAWVEYQKTETISGLPAPKGLKEGDRFPEPIFTPTTKAEVGHDENISMEEVEQLAGKDLAGDLKEMTIKIYQYAHDYALERGIILADTKMEFGLLDGELILIDELLTPDSSRFWDVEGYAPGKSQPNYDKQFVRDWLIESGWDREPPAPGLPDEITAKTRDRYLIAYERLTGHALIV